MNDILKQSSDTGDALASTIPQNTEDLSVRYFSVPLPSNGKLGYPAEVEYRDIMVRDEKILATATEGNYLAVLHKILKSLLKDQSFFEKMTVHDRDFLLLWIWANNYSSQKTIDVTCPACGAKSPLTIDLTKLPVSDISPEITVPFRMTLSDGRVALLKLLSIGAQNSAVAYMKDHKGEDFETVVISFAMEIENKVFGPAQKLEWISNNIKGRDMALIRGFHERFKYGINDRVEHECPECREVTQEKVPFQPEWLRPTISDNFAEVLRLNEETANQSNPRGPDAGK